MEEKKKKKDLHKKTIPFRLNILFLLVFVAFSVLIVRLGVVQVVNGQSYTQNLIQTKQVTQTLQTPRGIMYDRNGVLLAGNKASPSVVFTRNQTMNSQDLIHLAQKLSSYLPVSTQKKVPSGELTTASITTRDLKDYWIGTHPNATQTKLTKVEQNSPNAYQLLLKRITTKDLKSITPSELKVVAIWRKLVQTSNLSPTTIATHLSTKEMAQIGEHLSLFNGSIQTSVAAIRYYPKGNLFYLGNVSQIPNHELSNYLAMNYNQNDLVGVSNLEKQYNNILNGVPKKLTFKTQNGAPVGSPTIQKGRRGSDLVLTIDYSLEQKVNKVIQQQILNYYKTDKLVRTAYAVVMNPNTGGILALCGQTLNPKTMTFTDASQGDLLNAYQIGSAVKGGTLTAGYENHAIPGVIMDKPILFKGGEFRSWTSGIGRVGPALALEHSSNVYMATIASKMAGFKIQDQGSHYFASLYNGSQFVHAFKTLRDVYSQYGLGATTGVDLPFESTGYQGPIPISEPGKIMQFAIGQFDTYTPLQMAQYVSTIANGGYRLAPHFLGSVHYPEAQPKKLGPTEYQMKPKLLDKVPVTSNQIQTIQKGFYLVTHAPQGTAAMLGRSPRYAKYKIAAKTGTAQLLAGSGLYNLSLVAYAPYNNPEVAISLIVPHIHDDHINEDIGGNIMKVYFDSKTQGK